MSYAEAASILVELAPGKDDREDRYGDPIVDGSSVVHVLVKHFGTMPMRRIRVRIEAEGPIQSIRDGGVPLGDHVMIFDDGHLEPGPEGFYAFRLTNGGEPTDASVTWMDGWKNWWTTHDRGLPHPSSDPNLAD